MRPENGVMQKGHTGPKSGSRGFDTPGFETYRGNNG